MNFIIFVTLSLFLTCNALPPKILRRFWTNTGFAPIGNDPREVLLSSDTLTNVDLISSLPNQGLETIRIHWLLDLVDSKGDKYGKLDKFLDGLVQKKMNLGLEIMSHRKFEYENDIYELLKRYTMRYGIEITSKWKLETWNEPDLKSYNVLNFTLDGLERISDESGHNFTLRGPAGLFRNPKNHEFCWKAVELCQDGTKKCPFDVITFHRKGNGSAESVFSETISLIVELSNTFPRLSQMKFSNDEADPIVTWSEPREFQADIRYAATVVETILLHWTAIYNEIINLESISHDNAFLSFYPHQFTQRTLLARFQMNNSNPWHTQFFQKPVFAALGLMANLGPLAFDIEKKQNWNGSDVIYLSTIGKGSKFYLSTILVMKKSIKTNIFRYELPQELLKRASNTTIWYSVEGIIDGVTDPYHFWVKNGSPAFPNPAFRDILRKIQTPLLLDHGKKETLTHFDITEERSSIILIRACEEGTPAPIKIHEIRLTKVTEDEVLIIWSDKFYEERCILTYQVYFQGKKDGKWEEITKNRHVPFMNFQFRAKNATLGCYKVRSVDILMQKSEFSEVHCM
ncbi:alpha-L-iduronidase isoform X2 [Culicoides brevitarsis]|uniref:alpha-L-iduronidase isoform X2 n=1 Tax=Culicoides brevitarsis TaxID=469753 RepID=UPI00307B165D